MIVNLTSIAIPRMGPGLIAGPTVVVQEQARRIVRINPPTLLLTGVKNLDIEPGVGAILAEHGTAENRCFLTSPPKLIGVSSRYSQLYFIAN